MKDPNVVLVIFSPIYSSYNISAGGVWDQLDDVTYDCFEGSSAASIETCLMRGITIPNPCPDQQSLV